MARNIARYGYGPNRSSDTPAAIVMAYHRKAYARHLARTARQDERRTGEKPPGTPLTDVQRVWSYVRQMGVRRPLTSRQQRRRAHKGARAAGRSRAACTVTGYPVACHRQVIELRRDAV